MRKEIDAEAEIDAEIDAKLESINLAIKQVAGLQEGISLMDAVMLTGDEKQKRKLINLKVKLVAEDLDYLINKYYAYLDYEVIAGFQVLLEQLDSRMNYTNLTLDLALALALSSPSNSNSNH